VTRNRLAAIDAATGAVTGAVTPWNPGANGRVNDLAMSGDIIYVGGEFWEIGGEARNRLAAIDAATGAVNPWDPQMSELWWGYGSYFVRVNALAVSGGVVYVG